RWPRRSLLTIVAAALTLALLPVGVLSVLQTLRSIEVAEQNYRSDRLAEAVRIATPEREAIVSSLGLATGLAEALATEAPDAPGCTALMRRTVARHPTLAFAGFVEPGGTTRCNSTEDTFTVSLPDKTRALFADPQPDVTLNPVGKISGAPVIAVSHPIYAPGGELRGMAALSFPVRLLDDARKALDVHPEADLVTFTPEGEIVTASTDADNVRDVLPADMTLSSLAEDEARSFATQNDAGEVRQFAVVPLAPGAAYALASWPARKPLPGQTLLLLSSLSFPVAMWLVSLAVALLSIHRLVLRPIGALRREMRSFADRRQIPATRGLGHAAAELRDIEGTFHRMAETIARDEATLENRIYEREVLLREVHHRVKNNLQLMSSIMNMQARRTASPEVRAAIRNLQERLASLATVHRTLYQSGDMAQVRADTLIEEVVRELVALASTARAPVELRFDLDPVTMEPDQAAPLALLTAEAATNALKYAAPDAEGARWLRIALSPTGDAEPRFELTVENSLAPGTGTEEAEGLGSMLIRAFASQLEASIEHGAEDGRYTVTLRFAATPDLRPGQGESASRDWD
ncbi:sensor histidine kinase, partial [Rhodosalinus sp.]|uniref:sensor histidine kinase n=1 Tax=Rhodosalinus sp. TaxID=2047741 RepID=UPI0035615EB5